MTIEIVSAPRSLKSRIEELCQQTFDEHRERQPFAFAENSYDVMIKPLIDQAFRSPEGFPLRHSPVIFAAMQADEMVGYIHISRWASDLGTTAYVNIDDIHVVKNHRGNGVGEKLLNHVRALADECDWHNLTATIWAGNAASHDLFARCGFAPSNVTMRYGSDRPATDLPPKPKQEYGQIAFIGLLLLLTTVLLALIFIYR